MSQSFETFGQLCPLTHGRFAEAQQIAQNFDNTPRLSPPPGGWRTKRCEHGLRCDSIEWLCEVCVPNTQDERDAKQRLLTSYAHADSHYRTVIARNGGAK